MSASDSFTPLSNGIYYLPRKLGRGRPRMPISPGLVAQLRNSPDRLTWKEITRQVNVTTSMMVSVDTVQDAYKRWLKEWKGVPPKDSPETVRCKNMIDGMKRCRQCTREDGLNVYKPVEEFTPIRRAGVNGEGGRYLSSDCKECLAKKKRKHKTVAPPPVAESDSPVAVVRSKGGRPPKVTGLKVWAAMATGESPKQIATRLKLKLHDVNKAVERGVEAVPAGKPTPDTWDAAVEAFLQARYSLGTPTLSALLSEQDGACAACGEGIPSLALVRLDSDRGTAVCGACDRVIRGAAKQAVEMERLERRLRYLRPAG